MTNMFNQEFSRKNKASRWSTQIMNVWHHTTYHNTSFLVGQIWQTIIYFSNPCNALEPETIVIKQHVCDEATKYCNKIN